MLDEIGGLTMLCCFVLLAPSCVGCVAFSRRYARVVAPSSRSTTAMNEEMMKSQTIDIMIRMDL